MRLLLTGATGYLGGRLLARLLEAGHEVRALVRSPGAARERLGSGFEAVAGDLARPETFPPALAGMDGVVHTAAVVKNWSRHPEEFERVNVAGTWALCEAALAAGARRFLYTSSFLALGPAAGGSPVTEEALDAPPVRFYNDYQSTKARAARLVRPFAQRGLDLVLVFPTVIFGPGAETDGNHVSRMLRMLQQRRFPGLIGPGDQRWNLAWVDDVVQGHLLALERGRPGEGYILGGEDRALGDLIGRAAERLSVPRPTRRLPFGVCHALATLEEMRARVTGKPPQLTHGEVEIYRHDWMYSSAKAERELDYRPRPFEDGFGRTLDWIRGAR